MELLYSHFHHFLFNMVMEKIGGKIYNPRMIRTYIYTGEYNDAQIDQAKKHQRFLPADQSKIERDIKRLEEALNSTTTSYEKNRLIRTLENKKRRVFSPDRILALSYEISSAEKRKKAQTETFNEISRVDLLELKTKPLKYSRKDLRFVQKGTDVQLAVDLVNYAHFNNYDVAIVCSGDLDLMESLNQIKSLGKTVVLVSHKSMVSPVMVKISDYFIDLSCLTNGEKSQISATGGYAPTSNQVPG
ncbi:MAG TPA: NYN domain-containing protein [Candidatus Nanoarchaeia archaeon]|nr:NYN domain-containing protein [Candidatus Nanoarchaeia archaeon]